MSNNYLKEAPAITLWIPQLLSIKTLQKLTQTDVTPKLNLSSLQTLTAKSDTFPLPKRLLWDDGKEDFFSTASYILHQTQDLPIAATKAQIELADVLKQSPERQNDFWIKVDPVNYMAGHNSMNVTKALQITKTESLKLLKAFNKHFSKEHLTLSYGSCNSWYLSVVQSVDLKTISLEKAMITPLLESYPTGNASSYWRTLMNETQMLFYNHPVNETRRINGLPEINGIWLWGEGSLDKSKIVMRPQTNIYTDNTFLHGASKVIQAKYDTLKSTDTFTLNKEIKHNVFVLNNFKDECTAISEDEFTYNFYDLEKKWFVPLLKSMKQQEISSLLLILGNAKQYHIKPKHLRRFWRPKLKIQNLFFSTDIKQTI